MVISNPLTSPTTPPAALLDALLEQLRRGEAIDLEALVAAHPADASEIRQLAAVVQFVHEAAEQIDPLADLDARVRLSRQKPTLGDFRVVREIARGGMGVVYEAHQLSLDRKVALKVLLPGVTVSPRALERFVREAKTAGVLQHNHIVPVYYVGEDDAIPYFAMQYIDGVSLAEKLRAKRAEGFKPDAAWFRRVATWGRQIADALRHAHGQAVIHRDIKPSNVLLAADDDVWVTDFGLARHDGQHSLTLSGDLVGTVRYMSPEQARGGGADERSDVYALGVTLYELASLRPAFDAESREAVLKQVLLDEPRRLGRVDPSIPRPLATIIHQAMEKRPEDRYATAADLGEDLRRFLAGERLVAQPPSAMEQLRRLGSKHKAVSSLAALLLATLTVFAASMTWQTYRLANERDRLALEVERHGRVSDFLQSILALANPHTSGFDFTMSEALDEAVARIEPELLDDPLVEAEVRATVADVYWSMGRLEEATTQLRRAIALRREQHGAVDDRLVSDCVHLADLLGFRGHPAESEALMREVLGDIGRRHSQYNAVVDRLGKSLASQGRNDEAQPLLEAALKARRALHGDRHPEVAESMRSLAVVKWWADEPTVAITLLRQSLAIRRAFAHEEPVMVARALGDLGSYLALPGGPLDYEESETVLLEALRIFEAAVDPDPVEVAAAMSLLAATVGHRGRSGEAEVLYREALAIKRSQLGDVHLEVAQTLWNFAVLLHRLERHGEAEPLLLEAVAIRREILGDDREDTRAVVAYLVRLYEDWDRPDEAARWGAMLSPAANGRP